MQQNKTHKIELQTSRGLSIITIDLGINRGFWEALSQKVKNQIISYHVKQVEKEELEK